MAALARTDIQAYVFPAQIQGAPQVRAVTLHGCFIRYTCCLTIKHDFMRGGRNKEVQHTAHVNGKWMGARAAPCCAEFMLQKHRSDLRPPEEDAWVALEQKGPINQAGGQQTDCSLGFRWV